MIKKEMSTKNKILLESSRLFAFNGYSNVSLRDIAAAVGIKAPSIYNHFSGKESILKAIIKGHAEALNKYYKTDAELDELIKIQHPKEVLKGLSIVFDAEEFEFLMNVTCINMKEQFQVDFVGEAQMNHIYTSEQRVINVMEKLIAAKKVKNCDVASFAKTWIYAVNYHALRCIHLYTTVGNSNAIDKDMERIADFMVAQITLIDDAGE